MNSNKRYLKIIIIVVILSLGFFLAIGSKLIKSRKPEYIVLENSKVFHKENNAWLSYDGNKAFNWKLFNIYVNHQHIGKKYLYYNEKMYLFNKKKEALKYDGDLIAFSNSKYKDLEFEINNSSDNTYLNTLLTENDIDTNQELTSNYYVDIDIDNDDITERLYVVSNRFPIDNINNSEYFDFVFLVKNNSIIVIYKNIEKTDNSYSGCKPYIRNIISIPKEKNKAIILNCAYYSTSRIDSDLYLYNDDKFEKAELTK